MLNNLTSPQKPPKVEEKASLENLISKFGVSPAQGLSDAEVNNRIGKYGYNELPEEKTNPVLKFLSYFWGPIPWMIEAAVILSAFVRDWTDFTIILILLIMNAVVGFWEEYQAGNAIEALKKKLALEARVLRSGKWKNISARELVCGDIIRLRLGDIIPADAKLLEGDPIEVDQSALTGESLPVERKKGDNVYSGSIVNQGEIEAIVYATGAGTYFGKTAQMVEGAKATSHFQKAVLKIGDYLIMIAVALVVLILVTALFRHESLLTTLRFALVLTVAAIPVAMPTVLSVTMAVGAKLLAAQNAIVRRLASIEEMAGIDILCSDKTGTLTQNKLTPGKTVSFGSAEKDDIALCGALASRAEDKDPIDLAVISGLKDSNVLDTYKIIHFQPFDPVHKRTEADVEDNKGNHFKVSKGAPQVIFELASNKGDVKDVLEKTVNEFAGKGYRSLGVARTDKKGRWQYLGVIPLYDPPREDCKETIAAAGKMGVKVKMVTGDQVAIAREIARQTGLGTNILDARMFGDTKHHEAERLAESIERADGFAQVFPEHKYHIVDVLQKRGHIVGMTGDGVNDAPALKKADAGVAVSGATDAARAAADMVLLSPGLSVIIDAIRESRKIFQRMNSYATYRIAETIRVLLFMTLSILVFRFYPVTAVMIVLLALLNDGAILSIAYDRAHISNEPEAWNMTRVLGVATTLGMTGVVASFGLFYLAERIFMLNRETIQTLMYLKLSVAGHMTIFLTRTRGHFWQDRPSNILLGAVVGTQLVATVIAVYGLFMNPIGWGWALIVWGYAFVWFLFNDWIEIWALRIFDVKQPGFLSKR
ncbi:MAG: plasma-membrane proton-efflux P-type ATPase [Sedimentisphaerales bacterium]|nr:plasma-membrane proton-efflux P-type ATPase [Sedimentisphaerales bacterium]